MNSNDLLRDTNIIEKNEFVDIFAGAIAAARNERLNKISLDQSLARDYNQTQSHGVGGYSSNTGVDRTVNMSAIQEQELYEILTSAIQMGSQYKIMNQAKLSCTLNSVQSHNLLHILQREGGLHDFDASKIVKYLEVSGQVDLGRLDDLLNNAKRVAIRKSEYLKTIDRALE